MRNIIGFLFGNTIRTVITIVVLLIIGGGLFYKFGYEAMFESYTGVVNAELTFDTSVRLSHSEFEALADKLTYEARLKKAEVITVDETNDFTRRLKIEMLMKTASFLRETEYTHIKYFRNAGIRQYEGPKTCTKCHETMTVHTHDGQTKEVNTLDDVVSTIHYQFQRMASGFTTYGYDGREVNAPGSRPIPVGKIDRACGIPGSFSWTGWASLIEAKPESLHGEIEYRSEGCGQCHIGGNYHPATEKMMPVGDVPPEAKQGIDCLICHSQAYDMNYKYVIEDENGLRWNQDRTMAAAMTVGQPKNENCLNCHQHNMGGDIFQYNISAQNLGYKNKRLLHSGAKRGNPFSPHTDVHYAAGIQCTDCHIPEGHKIPRGTKGTDLVANDLPGVSVACENCHTSAPHTKNIQERVILNGHVNRIACETCHITKLEEFNVVLRDWVHPTWDAEEGIWHPTDIYRTGKVGKGFAFLWFNGYGTFLANALGNNPLKTDTYDPLMNQLTHLDSKDVCDQVKPQIQGLLADYKIDAEPYLKSACNTLSQLTPEMLEKRKQMIAENVRPRMNQGESKLYPFKIFNAMMYEDMGNQGPFGAMILPFDYPTYFETGDAKEAVKVAIQNPIVERMYQTPFKVYMMDEFMKYFGVGEWNATFPLQNGKLINVEPKWMRQMGSLMVNHGIQRDARQCADCHTPGGIINYEALGYPSERARELENLPELKQMKQMGYTSK